MIRPRFVRQAGALLLSAMAATACHRTLALEDMPSGTKVTIAMQDGRRVTGALVSVDPGAVVVQSDRTDSRMWLTRTHIAKVLSGGSVPRQPATLRDAIAPIGSTLQVRLDTGVASDASRVEESVRATLTAPVVANGVTIAPAGSKLLGRITTARESGRVRGRAALGLRFDRLRTDAVTYDIRTAPMRWMAKSTVSTDAAKVGIGAAAGAVVGALAGGGKGVAVGSAIGAGGGSAVVLGTKGKEIRLGAGTRLRVTLTAPLSVMAPPDDDDD